MTLTLIPDSGCPVTLRDVGLDGASEGLDIVYTARSDGKVVAEFTDADMEFVIVKLNRPLTGVIKEAQT